MGHARKLSIQAKFLLLAISVLTVTVGTMSAIEITNLKSVYLNNLQMRSYLVAQGVRGIIYKNLEYLPLSGLSGMSGYLQGVIKDQKDIGYCYVADDKGLVLYHSLDPSEEGRTVPRIKFGTERTRMIFAGGYYETVAPLRKGLTFIGTIHVGVSKAIVGSVIRGTISRNLAIFLVIIVLSSSLMYFLFHISISRPLLHLADRLVNLSARLGLDIGAPGGGGIHYELDDLAVSFDLAAEGLEKKTLSEEYIQGMMRGMAEAFIVTDHRGNIRMTNKVTSDLLGYDADEIRGMNIKNILKKEDADRIGIDIGLSGEGPVIVALTDMQKTYDVMFIGREGKTVPVLLSASLIADKNSVLKGTIWTATDITTIRESENRLKRLNEDLRKNERAVLNILSDLQRSHGDLRNSQDQLVRQAKMASLGRLVSDMAHEVNNPLMVILGRAQLGLMDGATPEEIKENLEIVQDQCVRAKDIIERLLIFSKPSKGKQSEADVNTLVEFVAKLIEYQYSLNNIKVIREYTPDLPKVLIDEKQMHEVFMNIVKNSAEAMPKGGNIHIRTRAEGDSVAVDISDTGAGIPENMLNEIFDPFFTTKENGTGLGLSVSYAIVKAHGGDIRYKSEVGRGTTATVSLSVPGKEG